MDDSPHARACVIVKFCEQMRKFGLGRLEPWTGGGVVVDPRAPGKIVVVYSAGQEWMIAMGNDASRHVEKPLAPKEVGQTSPVVNAAAMQVAFAIGQAPQPSLPTSLRHQRPLELL